MPYVTGDDPGTAVYCIQIAVPDDLLFTAALNGALAEMTDPDNWEELGSGTPAEYAALAQAMIDSITEVTC